MEPLCPGHSIYEHVRVHVRQDGPGLLPGGDELPDEVSGGMTTPGGIRFSSGAWEGLQARVMASEGRDASAVAEDVHAELVKLAARPTKEGEARLVALLHGSELRRVADLVLERLSEKPPRNPGQVYRVMRDLFLNSGHRDVVKLSMAAMATFRNSADIPLFHAIGRHDEFTLYAAVALAKVCDDPFPEWLALARQVEGWGRVELVERLLQDPRPDLCDFLLREGYRNKVEGGYTALAIAQGCGLREVLEGPEPDETILRGATVILATLAGDAHGGPDGGILDYADGPRIIERFLLLVASKVRTLEDFLCLGEIRAFAADDGGDDESEQRLLAAGWTRELRTRVVELCDEVLSRSEWRERAREAFDSSDRGERWRAPTVAHLMGLRDELITRVKAEPLNEWLWFYLSKGVSEEQMRETLDLAQALLDVPSIATGRGEVLTRGPGFATHECVEMIVQELRSFPGLGWDLIRLSLQSPLIRNRTMAIQALTAWGPEHLSPEMVECVREGLSDPDKSVREDSEEFMARIGAQGRSK